MTDDRPSEVLGALPRTRPHRRSEKRAGARPAAAETPEAEVTQPQEAPSEPTATVTATAAPATTAAAATAAPPKPKGTAPKASAPKASAPKAAAAKTTPRKPTATKRASAPHIAPTPIGAGAAIADSPRSKPIRQPKQPAGVPPVPAGRRRPVPISGADVLGTAVRAAAELTEIGLTATARALRGALSRLPRP